MNALYANVWGKLNLLREKSLIKRSLAGAGLDTRHKLKLGNSQAAWKHCRDTECDFEGDAYRGGTLEIDQATLCQISKNNECIRELGDDIGLAAH
jgi:uncharacterized protein YecT (DUF1311 family)